MPYSQTPTLVTANWLHDHLEDPSLVIVDCRWKLIDKDYGAKVYTQGHIPGAQRLDLDRQLASPPGRYGGRHPLPLPDAFSRDMGALGIDDQTHVICYDDDVAGAARCWWCLSYYGHQKVSILDGGLTAWTAQGYSLSQETLAAPLPKHFTARPDPRMVVDYQTVRNLQSIFPIIDARNAERYSGAAEPVDTAAGHIPGALNYPFGQFLSPEGKFKSPEDLRNLLAPVLQQSREPIVYCGSGVTACVAAAALRSVGAEPLLYPGSWSDWIQHEDAPIASS